MPTNVTPEYKDAEEAFRKAREPKERLDCLREMLRTIPKHKGTEHLQRDIKTRIKQLSEELSGPKKGGGRKGPSHVVRPDGAAQLCMIGPPNSGKSSLHVRLTGSRSDVGPYPFTTHLPEPGMMPYEDIYFQLVDLPPVSADFFEPWLVNTLQHADGVLLVIDPNDPESLEQIPIIIERLAEKKIFLTANWPGIDAGNQAQVDNDDPFRLDLPTVLIANKGDLDPNSNDVDILEELLGLQFPALTMSAETGDGTGELGKFLFRALEIVRVYTKTPGKSQARDNKPFTVRRGGTVLDVARLVHKEMARDLKFARMWGTDVFDGQQVSPEHFVADGDLVELHM